MRQKLNLDKPYFKAGKPIIGYTDTSTVKLDFDETTFKKVRYIALRVCKWFKLEGFIILKSSSKCFHVVFNKPVSWRQNQSVIAWTCYITGFNLPLMRYLVMQCIKKSSTLRLGPKRRKPMPCVVYRYGLQDCMVKNYLEERRMVKEILKRASF